MPARLGIAVRIISGPVPEVGGVAEQQMRDLKNWTGCPAPKPVTLEGRYVRIEPYDRAKHLDALWQAFGGLNINARLQYFSQDDFRGVEDFDA